MAGRGADGLGEPAARPWWTDLSDRTGITQVVVGEQSGEADAARPEYVVPVKGRVRRRTDGLADGLENPNMATGEIEVVAEVLLLLNEAKTRLSRPPKRRLRMKRCD